MLATETKTLVGHYKQITVFIQTERFPHLPPVTKAVCSLPPIFPGSFPEILGLSPLPTANVESTELLLSAVCPQGYAWQSWGASALLAWGTDPASWEGPSPALAPSAELIGPPWQPHAESCSFFLLCRNLATHCRHLGDWPPDRSPGLWSPALGWCWGAGPQVVLVQLAAPSTMASLLIGS